MRNEEESSAARPSAPTAPPHAVAGARLEELRGGPGGLVRRTPPASALPPAFTATWSNVPLSAVSVTTLSTSTPVLATLLVTVAADSGVADGEAEAAAADEGPPEPTVLDSPVRALSTSSGLS